MTTPACRGCGTCSQGRRICATPEACHLDEPLITPNEAMGWPAKALIVAICIVALICAVSPALAGVL